MKINPQTQTTDELPPDDDPFEWKQVSDCLSPELRRLLDGVRDSAPR